MRPKNWGGRNGFSYLTGPSIVREATLCVCSGSQFGNTAEVARRGQTLPWSSPQEPAVPRDGWAWPSDRFHLEEVSASETEKCESNTLETKGVASSIRFSEVRTGKSTSQCWTSANDPAAAKVGKISEDNFFIFNQIGSCWKRWMVHCYISVAKWEEKLPFWFRFGHF